MSKKIQELLLNEEGIKKAAAGSLEGDFSSPPPLFFLCFGNGANSGLLRLTETIPCPNSRVSDWALEVIIMDGGAPDALQVKQVVQSSSASPRPLPRMSSIPSFPHTEFC